MYDGVELIERYTHRRISVLRLKLIGGIRQYAKSIIPIEDVRPTYITGGVTLMARFAFDVEAHAIWGLRFDLETCCNRHESVQRRIRDIFIFLPAVV